MANEEGHRAQHSVSFVVQCAAGTPPVPRLKDGTEERLHLKDGTRLTITESSAVQRKDPSCHA
eukprot:1161131-Pelagomonas_calceolata.AAC.13